MTLLEAAKKAKAERRSVFIIGNGGSYANAMHICNDLLSVGVRAFTMDPSTLTAFSNDHGYPYAFQRWLHVVANPSDILIALSGSGKSANILKAIDAAESMGLDVVKVFGAANGFQMQEAEEVQIRLGHAAMKALKNG